MRIFQVSAIEARKSLVTEMREKDKSSSGNPSNKITITINVDDDNDNSPEFSPSKKNLNPIQSIYTFQIIFQIIIELESTYCH